MRIEVTAGLALIVSILVSPAQEAIVLGQLPKSVEFSSEGPWGKLDFYEIKLSSHFVNQVFYLRRRAEFSRIRRFRTARHD